MIERLNAILIIAIVQNGSERALRDFFQPTLPAAAGEFVSCLSSDDFSMEVTISARVPGLVDIVRALLGDHVRQVTTRHIL